MLNVELPNMKQSWSLDSLLELSAVPDSPTKHAHAFNVNVDELASEASSPSTAATGSPPSTHWGQSHLYRPESDTLPEPEELIARVNAANSNSRNIAIAAVGGSDNNGKPYWFRCGDILRCSADGKKCSGKGHYVLMRDRKQSFTLTISDEAHAYDATQLGLVNAKGKSPARAKTARGSAAVGAVVHDPLIGCVVKHEGDQLTVEAKLNDLLCTETGDMYCLSLNRPNQGPLYSEPFRLIAKARHRRTSTARAPPNVDALSSQSHPVTAVALEPPALAGAADSPHELRRKLSRALERVHELEQQVHQLEQEKKQKTEDRDFLDAETLKFLDLANGLAGSLSVPVASQDGALAEAIQRATE